MRRGFSIFLILMFGLSPLSSLVGDSEDANLPACCRRHGAHHCAIAAQMAARAEQARSDKTPLISAPMTCPSYPGVVAFLTAPTQALAAAARTGETLLRFEYLQAVVQKAPLSASLQSHSGRGPPGIKHQLMLAENR